MQFKPDWSEFERHIHTIVKNRSKFRSNRNADEGGSVFEGFNNYMRVLKQKAKKLIMSSPFKAYEILYIEKRQKYEISHDFNRFRLYMRLYAPWSGGDWF